MLSNNLQAYLNLDSRDCPGLKYAVFVNGKLVGTGHDLAVLLQKARKKHPSKIPAIAKVPGPQTLVLGRHVGD